MNQYADPKPSKSLQKITWIAIGLVFLSLGTLILAFDGIFPSGNTFQVEIDDPAPEDIFAPEDRTYISTVRTEQKRNEARNSTAPVYVPIPDIGPRQIALANELIEYISMIRDSRFYMPEQKLQDLKAIELLKNMREETWISVRDASPSRWTLLSTGIVAVLDRTIRRDIPPETLEAEYPLIAGRVDASISDVDRTIIVEFVSQLIVPTIALDEAATQAAREAAATAIPQEEISFRRGALIVNKGIKIGPLEMEALEQFNLLQQPNNAPRIILGSFILLALVMAAMLAYIARFHLWLFDDYGMLALIAVLFLEFLLGARLFGPDGFNQTYLFPAAALSLLLTTLIGPNMAIIATAALAVLVGIMLDDNSLQLASQTAIGGFTGVLALGKRERQSSYFFAGMMIGLANAGVVLATALIGSDTPDIISVIGKMVVAVIGGLFAAGIALVELGVISSLLNLTTFVRLIDLMRPDQPLLQRLLREAPGTFQHSLQVANLAELAAERIGVDATLVRVAAMYHDIGKMLNPYFFVENQKGFNPHDTINDPHRSARIVISHVTEGDRMARRAHLPRRIRDFIREHHGTSRPFFYYKALEQVGGDDTKLNKADFTYPGPAPRSKETAIMMLADSIESAARSIQPRNEEEVNGVVNMIFEKVLQEGQLDYSPLTLNEIKIVREVFVDTLQGIYHTRIKYPGQETAARIAAPGAKISQEVPSKTMDTVLAKIADYEPDVALVKDTLEDEIITPLDTIEKKTTDKKPVSDGAKTIDSQEDVEEENAVLPTRTTPVIKRTDTRPFDVIPDLENAPDAKRTVPDEIIIGDDELDQQNSASPENQPSEE